MNIEPCPFCGKQAHIITDYRFYTYDISCSDPGCFAYKVREEARYYSPESAIDHWNTRIYDDLLERLEDDGK